MFAFVIKKVNSRNIFLLVNPLLAYVRPEYHASLEVVVHGTGGPGAVHYGRHAGPVQGQFPHVCLVSE